MRRPSLDKQQLVKLGWLCLNAAGPWERKSLEFSQPFMPSNTHVAIHDKDQSRTHADRPPRRLFQRRTHPPGDLMPSHAASGGSPRLVCHGDLPQGAEPRSLHSAQACSAVAATACASCCSAAATGDDSGASCCSVAATGGAGCSCSAAATCMAAARSLRPIPGRGRHRVLLPTLAWIRQSARPWTHDNPAPDR